MIDFFMYFSFFLLFCIVDYFEFFKAKWFKIIFKIKELYEELFWLYRKHFEKSEDLASLPAWFLSVVNKVAVGSTFSSVLKT